MELAAAEEYAPAPRYSTSPLPAGSHPVGADEPPASADGPCATGSFLLCTADSFLCPCEKWHGTISGPRLLSWTLCHLLPLFVISPPCAVPDSFGHSTIVPKAS